MKHRFAKSSRDRDIVGRLIDAIGPEEDIATVSAALAHVAGIACAITAEEWGCDVREAAETHAMLVRECVRMISTETA